VARQNASVDNLREDQISFRANKLNVAPKATEVINRLPNLNQVQFPQEAFQQPDRESMTANFISNLLPKAGEVVGDVVSRGKEIAGTGLEKLTELAKDPRTYEVLSNVLAVGSAPYSPQLSQTYGNIASGIRENRIAKQEAETEKAKLASELLKQDNNALRTYKISGFREAREGDNPDFIQEAPLPSGKTVSMFNQKASTEAGKLQIDIDKNSIDFANKLNLLKKEGFKNINTENIPDRFIVNQTNPITGEEISLVNTKDLNERKKEIEKEVNYNKIIKNKNLEIKRNINKLLTKDADGNWALTDLGLIITKGPISRTISRKLGESAQIDADTARNFIVSNLTIDKLQDIRKNSPTGGSLGNVSNADIILLKNAAIALEEGGSAKKIAETLGILSEELDKFNTRAITDPKELLFRDPFKSESLETGETSTGVIWSVDQ